MGRGSDSGEGLWMIQTAIVKGVPVLTMAMYARFASRGEADFQDKLLSAKRFGFGGHLENQTNRNERKPMLIKLSTDKTVSDAAAALQAAVQANHFGVMQVHNLKETMTKKGIEFDRECLIFEVCQPQQAKKVLDENMSVSTALPCRISIYEEGGKTILATLKPTTLLAMFNAPQLEGVAQEVEDTIVNIMQAAG